MASIQNDLLHENGHLKSTPISCYSVRYNYYYRNLNYYDGVIKCTLKN